MSPLRLFFGSFWRNRQLIFQLTRREIVGRYKGSMLGMLWSLLLPLFMLSVYTFIFSVVFQSRWGVSHGGKFEFALILFCGLIAYNIFSECVMRAPTLVLNNVMYVKKVVFPLEILAWTSIGSALYFALTNLIILIVFQYFVAGFLHWTIMLYPLVLLPLVLSVLGLSWFLASLGVFVRDIGHLVGVVISVLLFLSPVFYPVSAVPPGFQTVLALNPLTFVIEQSREVVLWGHQPAWGAFGVYLAASFVIAWAGYSWFQKTRKGFADVV